MYDVHIIDIIGIICMTFSAWISVLNAINQKMWSIKWMRLLLNMNCFLKMSPWSEELNKIKAVSQAGANAKRKLQYLHIDFGIEQFVQVLFAGRVPYRHLKVPDHKRTKFYKRPCPGPSTRNTCHRVKLEMIWNAKQKLLHLKCKMEAIKLTHRLWHRAIRQGPFRWWGAI